MFIFVGQAKLLTFEVAGKGFSNSEVSGSSEASDEHRNLWRLEPWLRTLEDVR